MGPARWTPQTHEQQREKIDVEDEGSMREILQGSGSCPTSQGGPPEPGFASGDSTSLYALGTARRPQRPHCWRKTALDPEARHPPSSRV